MKYCEKCGHQLVVKECEQEGMIDYCPSCKEFKFPMFNSAISAIVFNPEKTKILLIQQYGKKDNILVAGYINRGENAKEALIREIMEEIHLNVSIFEYNDNEFFEKTNTLIHNYAVVVESEYFQLTDEIDHAQWFPIEEAIKAIKPHSLAKTFLKRYLKNMQKECK